MKVVINGRFLENITTGTQRVAIEILKALDGIDTPGIEFILLIPKTVQNPPLRLKKIKTIKIGMVGGNGWIQGALPLYAICNKAGILTISGGSPIIKPDYVYIHDMLIKRHAQSYSRAYRLFYEFIYFFCIKRMRLIFANSLFSKKEILRFYNVGDDKIAVTYLSGEHFRLIKEDDGVIEKFGLSGEYYLSVGSMAAHKNHKYIRRLARLHPNRLFVVAGGSAKNFTRLERDGSSISNVIYTGYVSDGELKALYTNCRGAIFPSLYEGFGLPVLEAMESGCRSIAVSRIPVFMELFAEGTYKFDPKEEKKFDFSEFNKTMIRDDAYLKYRAKYSWRQVADKIYKEIKKDEM